ncbi:50S ribosomal protein L22 [Candidatus Uhrbacteria bacterium]|nr:50S ribosomal protein L22 [Candidatus Uhrbacteria bacterium]
MQTLAHLRNLRMSSRKVRLVADLVRGMDVDEADAQLSHLRKAATVPVQKLLRSAIANAEHNAKLDRRNLFVHQIFVNQGPTLKRFRPRAFGRAAPIRKRSSHLTVVLEERVPTKGNVKREEGRGQGVKAPMVVGERPKVPRADAHEHAAGPLRPTGTTPETKEPFDVRRKGKHRHQEHEDARSGKRAGGFFKRLFTRRSGER